MDGLGTMEPFDWQCERVGGTPFGGIHLVVIVLRASAFRSLVRSTLR
jgi:hypothetical protein